MIDEQQLKQFHLFFDSYMESFLQSDDDVRIHVRLKYEHTLKVKKLSEDIADSLHLTESEILLVSTIALFHDLGRFKQFADYGTFDDSKSVDHAQLAIDILDEKQILTSLTETEQQLVRSAILNHNKFKIEEQDEKTILFCQIIRDADKLDAMRVMIDHYKQVNVKPNVLAHHLPVSNNISAKVAKALKNHKSVLKSDVETTTDFKLLQMGWVFDLNFKRSYHLFSEMQLAKKLYDTLPKNDEVIELYRVVKIYLENQLL